MTEKTKDYSAGEFRFVVEVQRPRYLNDDTGDNAGGQGEPVWETIFEINCKITDKTGRETYGDGTQGRIRTYQYFQFVSWWREGIETTDRLLFQNTPFNITGINNIELRNKFIEITAESGVEQ